MAVCVASRAGATVEPGSSFLNPVVGFTAAVTRVINKVILKIIKPFGRGYKSTAPVAFGFLWQYHFCFWLQSKI